MSSSESPCAACKHFNRPCPPDCVFAPYFPPDQPQKFEIAHEVYGAGNVAYLLKEMSPNSREAGVNSLVYEASACLCDPVNGSCGHIRFLEHELEEIKSKIDLARRELATDRDSDEAVMPMFQSQSFLPQQHIDNPSSTAAQAQHGSFPVMGMGTGSSQHTGNQPSSSTAAQAQHGMFPVMGMGTGASRGWQLPTPEPQHQQQQELLRNFEQRQQQAPPQTQQQKSGNNKGPSCFPF